MSFFNTTCELQHRTPLTSPITHESALELLHDHDFLIRLDPEFVEYKEEQPDDASPGSKYYTVTDHMKGIPKAIYDAKVTYKAELTDVEDGIKWVIKAPLGFVQNSHWRLEQEGTDLILIEDVHLSCSRLMMGTVRGKCEESWSGIHGKFVDTALERASATRSLDPEPQS